MKGISSARGSMTGSMKTAPTSIHRPKSNSGAPNSKLNAHDQLSLLKSKHLLGRGHSNYGQT